MDSRRNPDKLSNLPNFLLLLIISSLPFDEAVKTSVLSKRWKNLYREIPTTNIVFKESEFLKCYVSDDEETKRVNKVSFICFMHGWVLRLSDQVIESFELYLPKPMGFETDIKSIIEFAASKQVKNLILDFADPSWLTRSEAASEENVIQLPDSIYNLTNLESLKLFFCKFDPSRFTNPGSLEVLSFGWIQLGNFMSLISNTPILEILSIQNCWNVDLESITGYNNRLSELVLENCGFAVPYSTLDLPNIQFFKYSGNVHYFQFMRVNRLMEEANLDFGTETEYDEETGSQLCGLLYDLLSARKLTVCPFLVQLIQEGEDPVQLQAPMETRHLVIKTNLLPNEFVGIRLMINSCRDLETLTFQMVAPRPVEMTASRINPETYWKFEIKHKCLKKTLKVVEFKNFTGGLNELHVLEFLIRCGRVLERVDLYLPYGMEESQRLKARDAAETVRTRFRAISKRLRIFMYG